MVFGFLLLPFVFANAVSWKWETMGKKKKTENTTVLCYLELRFSHWYNVCRHLSIVLHTRICVLLLHKFHILHSPDTELIAYSLNYFSVFELVNNFGYTFFPVLFFFFILCSELVLNCKLLKNISPHAPAILKM